MRIGLRATAIVVLLAIVAAACGGDGDDTASGSRSPVVESGAGRSGTVSDALAAAGIVVVDDPSPVSGGGLQVWQWQVDTWTREYAAKNGFVGEDLDEVVGDIGGIPFSYFIAGWASGIDTDNAALARELMGDQRWDDAPTIIFPSIVLSLFVDDAIDALSIAAVPTEVDGDLEGDEDASGFVDGRDLRLTAAHGPLRAEAAPPGLCSAVLDFVHTGLTEVFAALQFNSDIIVLSFFTDIVDLATALVGDLIIGLADLVTEEIAEAIATALGVINLITMISGLIKPWTVEVSPSAYMTSFSITGAPNNQQTFTASVADPLRVDLDIAWPDEIVDCADLLDVPLPDFGDGYGDTEVEWFMRWGDDPPLGSAVEVDQVFDEEGFAELQWVTGNEESDEGDQQVDVVVATVKPQITVVEELQLLAASFVIGALPSLTPDVVLAEIQAIYEDVTQPIWDSLTELLQPSASTDVRVIYHLPPEEEAPDLLGGGEWTILEISGDVVQERTDRMQTQSVAFSANHMSVGIDAAGAVRGTGQFGQHFSLFIESRDDLIGGQFTELRVRQPFQAMALSGDASALQASGELDHEEYVNVSEGALDIIGGFALDAEGLGFGSDVFTESRTIRISGVACGRAGAIINGHTAWVGLRTDVGRFDAALAAAGELSKGNEDDRLAGVAADQLTDLFADECVSDAARAAANGVGRLLAQGIG